MIRLAAWTLLGTVVAAGAALAYGAILVARDEREQRDALRRER